MTSQHNTTARPRWEDLYNGSWVHPLHGLIKRIRREHYLCYPEELNPNLKHGPYKTLADAKRASVEHGSEA